MNDILSTIAAEISLLQQVRALLTSSGTSRRAKKSASSSSVKVKRVLSPEARERNRSSPAQTVGCSEESREVDMYVPRARERARIIGRPDVFRVVQIDAELGVADLFPLQSSINVEEDVPFSDLEP